MGTVPISRNVRHDANMGGFIKNTALDVLFGVIFLGGAALSGLVAGGVALGPGYVIYGFFAAVSGSHEDNFAALAPWIVGIVGGLVAAGVVGHTRTQRARPSQPSQST